MLLHCSGTSSSDLNKPPQETYICVFMCDLIWRGREIYSVKRQTRYIYPFKFEYQTLLFVISALSANYILRIFHLFSSTCYKLSQI